MTTELVERNLRKWLADQSLEEIAVVVRSLTHEVCLRQIGVLQHADAKKLDNVFGALAQASAYLDRVCAARARESAS